MIKPLNKEQLESIDKYAEGSDVDKKYARCYQLLTSSNLNFGHGTGAMGEVYNLIFLMEYYLNKDEVKPIEDMPDSISWVSGLYKELNDD